MLYPSHYRLGTMMNGKTFDKPDLYPYEIIYAALTIANQRIPSGSFSEIRPYLQAFSYSGSNYMTYGYNEIYDEIRGMNAAGYNEWILWNATANYPTGSYGESG
jgi:hypothetical protein